jgi:hypothetical protein
MAIARDILIKDYGTGGSVKGVPALSDDKSFDYKITRYPEDLGSSSRNHYIMFHILQQRESQYKTSEVSNSDFAARTENERRGSYVNTPFGSVVKKGAELFTPTTNSKESTQSWYNPLVPQALTTAGDFAGTVLTSGLGEIQKLGANVEKIEFVRTVTKTQNSIALYMPDTLNFVQGQGYEDLAMGNSLITALFAGGGAVFDSIKQFRDSSGGSDAAKVLGDSLIKNMSPFVVNAIGQKFGNFGRAVAAAGQGFVTNPMIEVVYSSPALRTFRFDFAFYPESEREARIVQKIIQTFQFHQAPEVLQNGTNGYFLVPPSEFDIEFYYAGTENVNIPSISTCVLTSMDVDYAPNGWTAYEVPGQAPQIGGTGMPVAIKMSLEFKETTMVFKSSRQFDKKA